MVRRTHEEGAVGREKQSRRVAAGERDPRLGDENLFDVNQRLPIETSPRQGCGVDRSRPAATASLRRWSCAGRRGLRNVIRKIDQAVRCEFRMKRDIQQTARTSCLHLGDARYRFRIQYAVSDDSKTSGALRHEHVSIRQPGKTPWMRQPFRHHGHANTSVPLGRRVVPGTVTQRVRAPLLGIGRRYHHYKQYKNDSLHKRTRLTKKETESNFTDMICGTMKPIKAILLGLMLIAVALPAAAQLPTPNEAGVSAGHHIFVVKDLDATNKFWAALGAQPGQLGNLRLLKFPGVLFLARQGNNTGGTEGSTIEYLGFKVKNMKESLSKWQASGIKPMPGGTATEVFLKGPDDIK